MLASRTRYALVVVSSILVGCGTNFAGGGGGGTGGAGPANGSGGSSGTRGPTTVTTGTSGDTSVSVTTSTTSTVTTTVSGTGGASVVSSSVGTGGATVSSSIGVGGATVSTTSTSVVTSTATGGTCSPSTCFQPFICCGGACVNPDNDILNCGGCGAPACGGAHPYCNNGHCGQAPCGDMFDPDAGPPICAGTQFCCAESCCNPGEICCEINEGAAMGPRCVAPMNGTCPTGCPNCP